MKNTIIHKALCALSAALFAGSFVPNANAGPGPQQMFQTVKTAKQADSIKPGSTIAIACGNCAGITTYTVDKERSYLRGFKCPMCKREFHVVQSGGGGRGSVGLFRYTDDEQHTATLAVLRH